MIYIHIRTNNIFKFSTTTIYIIILKIKIIFPLYNKSKSNLFLNYLNLFNITVSKVYFNKLWWYNPDVISDCEIILLFLYMLFV